MNQLVAMILTRVIQNEKREYSFSRVRYRERNVKGSWKRLHLDLQLGLYEKCIDLRKIHKESVSRILAWGLLRYLNEIMIEIETGKHIPDNYQHPAYIFLSETKNHEYRYEIYWQYPMQMQLNL